MWRSQDYIKRETHLLTLGLVLSTVADSDLSCWLWNSVSPGSPLTPTDHTMALQPHPDETTRVSVREASGREKKEIRHKQRRFCSFFSFVSLHPNLPEWGGPGHWCCPVPILPVKPGPQVPLTTAQVLLLFSAALGPEILSGPLQKHQWRLP